MQTTQRANDIGRTTADFTGMRDISGSVTRGIFLCLLSVGATSTTLAQDVDAFNPLAQQTPSTLAIQADGKILIGGYLLNASNTLVGVQRLKVDGTVDTSFTELDVDSEVKAVAVQADGKILIGGHFNTLGLDTRHYLARLNANGTLDTSFADPDLDGDVWALAVQADGKVLAAGDFQNVGATARSYAARFNPNGTLDIGFADPQIDAPARAVALQANGSVLVGGYFLGAAGNTSLGSIIRFSASGA
ncbi:MAG: hypothetical protein ABI082_03635, partial [Dokdonella sp.]